MTPEQLRAQQTPVKERYKTDPAAARVTFRSTGQLDPTEPVCRIAAHGTTIASSLHPAAGGATESACSGDMLLDALVACAGVTLRVVAIAMGIPIRNGTIVAEADADFRGTLGISREVPVGVQEIRMRIELDADATPEQLDKLVQLTERYCIILQTLKTPPRLTVTRA